MMKELDYNKVLIDTLRMKLSAGVNPVWFVMDTLSIGKEAAYRRLRGEVPLLLQEAVLLSKALNISFNEIVEKVGCKTFYFNDLMIDYEMPGDEDYNFLQNYLGNLGQAENDPLSQMGVTTNRFPMQLSLLYKSLTKFALFKWYYMSGRRKVKEYQQIKIEDRMQHVLNDLRKSYLQFSTTYFIIDKQLSRSLASDLRYFTSVGLLNPEDAESIRGEAYKLLNFMEQLAINGRYENGNVVHMYVSDIHFNKSYYNVKAGDYYASVIEVCILNGLISTGENCYQRINEWLNSRRRLSTLISQSGELQRIAFFNEQRRQLEE